jgi:hypothetical protein
MPMKKTRKRLGAWCLAIVITAGAFLLAGTLTSNPSLLDRSRHVRLLDGKITPLGYQWHRNGYVLGERSWAGSGLELFQIDPESGSTTILRANTPQGNGYAFEDRGVISPDGRRRIATCEKELVLVSLDGGQDVSVPNHTQRTNGREIYDCTVAWYPDSSHWVELANEQGQNVLLIREPEVRQPRRVPVGITGRLQSLLGVTPDRRAVITVTNQAITQVVSAPLERGQRPAIVATMRPPRNGQFYRATLSADAKSILWTEIGGEPTSWSKRLLRALGSHRPPQRRELHALWTSDLNGRNWTLLGQECLPPSSVPPIGWAKFTPDGKRASFLFGSKFYIIDLP